MSKYTTIAQIKADIKISYAKILDFYSEIRADTHGMAYLIVEMKDNTTIWKGKIYTVESVFLWR